MAVKVVKVQVRTCDACGAEDAENVRFRLNGKMREKDLCQEHRDELKARSRPARRGRTPSTT